MIFLKKKSISYKGYNVPQDESWRISRTNRLLNIFSMIVSGAALSAAFPPLNWEILAFVALVPLLVQAIKNPVSMRLFGYGYIWSLSWSLIAFFWLREINPFIPFVLSLIIGLWGGVFALLCSFAWRWCIRGENELKKDFKVREANNLKFYQILFFSVLCGCFFVALEYIRIGMFPWNFIGVTQYKMLYLIQIVKFTGIYGVSFLIISVNASIAAAVWYLSEKIRGKDVDFKGVIINTAVFFCVVLFVCIYGFFASSRVEQEYFKGRKIRFGLVQGDISQRRNSNSDMAREALDIYIGLSHELAAMKPDIIIWPETAVPYPYYGGNRVSADYRRKVYELASGNKMPLLIGTLDFIINRDKSYDMTNAAFLIDATGFPAKKYYKINRVPFGEFIPFREYLPENVAEKIGMGRDLRAGNDPSPLEILPGIRAGISICYESIFASLARDEANLGANIFVAVNNDAWYPESSEPEQHCANAVFRMIENGLPAVRSGNNGASVWILPNGRVFKCMDDDLLSRSRKIGIFEVNVSGNVEKTFYTKYGDVFLFVLFAVLSAALIYGVYQYFSVLKSLHGSENEDDI